MTRLVESTSLTVVGEDILFPEGFDPKNNDRQVVQLTLDGGAVGQRRARYPEVPFSHTLQPVDESRDTHTMPLVGHEVADYLQWLSYAEQRVHDQWYTENYNSLREEALAFWQRTEPKIVKIVDQAEREGLFDNNFKPALICYMTADQAQYARYVRNAAPGTKECLQPVDAQELEDANIAQDFGSLLVVRQERTEEAYAKNLLAHYTGKFACEGSILVDHPDPARRRDELPDWHEHVIYQAQRLFGEESDQEETSQPTFFNDNDFAYLHAVPQGEKQPEVPEPTAAELAALQRIIASDASFVYPTDWHCETCDAAILVVRGKTRSKMVVYDVECPNCHHTDQTRALNGRVANMARDRDEGRVGLAQHIAKGLSFRSSSGGNPVGIRSGNYEYEHHPVNHA